VEQKLTLQQLNLLIKDTIYDSFPENIWVVAEIGELNVNRNGHCYIELLEKDSETDNIIARTRATIWAWQFRFIKPYFETTSGQALVAGIKVLVSAKVEFHEVYGFSLNITDIDPAFTMGDMARKRKEIIEKLSAEGVIDMNKEIPLPDIPSRIAIISSPTAAGYEDFINQLENNGNNYKFRTQLFEASMQGSRAANSIIQALEQIYALEPDFDVVIIIRGGGSQLDLTCFDDYELAFHVTQFPLPVLTGIGHEKDESVTDMVAHTKLKTPTAVAEFIIELMDYAAHEIEQLETSFVEKLEDIIQIETTRVEQAFRVFKPLVNAGLERASMQLKQISRDIKPLTNNIIEDQKYKLGKYMASLKSGSNAIIKNEAHVVSGLSSSLAYISKINIGHQQNLLDEKKHTAKLLAQQIIDIEKTKILWLEKNKELLDPKSVLKRGFSITLQNGKAVKNSKKLNKGDEIETILYKGTIKSKIK
jgi:exodeoxyribonuclease VII large subunit